MARESKNARSKSEVVASLPMACCDEVAAVEFLEKHRWGDKPTCAHCGSEAVYQIKNRKTGLRNHRFLWRCRECGKQYTVRVGTIYEESRIPLKHWCHVFWRSCTSKEGVSALEIRTQTDLSYKSALFMMHRIRWAMALARPTAKAPKSKPGPTEERLEIEGDWEQVMVKSLKKNKPVGGWPNQNQDSTFPSVKPVSTILDQHDS